MSNKLAIGIDLGTTYSSVAVYKDNKLELIKNFDDETITPSCVAFKASETLFGKKAKNYYEKVENVIYDFKRLIGRSFNKGVQKYLHRWYFNIKDDHDNPIITVSQKHKANKYTAVRISTIMLEELKRFAIYRLKNELNETVDAVISVPAVFNEEQRQCTLASAEAAGLNVLALINEPTAACLSYSLPKSDKTEKVLIFDFGGGTLDISLFSIKGMEFQVLETYGDSHLGGRDIDEKLLEFVLKEIKSKHNIDLSNNLSAKLKLLNACEHAKIVLSSKEVTKIVFDENIENHVKIEIERKDLIEQAESIFDRVKACLENMIKRDSCKGFRRLVLAGGSTRIPHIKDLVEKVFADNNLKISIKDLNIGEEVAKGAALLAAKLMENEDIKELNLTDIIPFTIHVKTPELKNETAILRSATAQVIFPQFNKIPDEKVIECDRLCDTMSIYEDDSLLTTLSYLIPPNANVRHNVIARYDLKFELDNNGMLTVTHINKQTNTSKVIFTRLTTRRRENIGF